MHPGVSFFGFNVGEDMVDGLYQNPQYGDYRNFSQVFF